jgi:hypothetical protein
MTTFIIHYPDNQTSHGTKINKVITCSSLEMLKSELLKIVTMDNLHDIKVIKITGYDSAMYTFDDDASYICSDKNIIKTPEIQNKLFPMAGKYLMLYNDSCQMYDYNGLKEAVKLLRDIPPTWKIITQPDCTVYTYDPVLNLFKSSNNTVLPAELTSHLAVNYKLIMHFYEDLNNPDKTYTKEMCQEKFVSKSISAENIRTYLTQLANTQKLKYEPSEHKNLYLIDVLCNDEKIGEINVVGLCFKGNIVTSTLGEPYESFKQIMKGVKETVELNRDPKKPVMEKLNKMLRSMEMCEDKQKFKDWLKELNKIVL